MLIDRKCIIAVFALFLPSAYADTEYNQKNNDVSVEENAYDLTGKTRPKASGSGTAAAKTEPSDSEVVQVSSEKKESPTTGISLSSNLGTGVAANEVKIGNAGTTPPMPPHLGGKTSPGQSVKIGSSGTSSIQGVAIPDVKASHESLNLGNSAGSTNGPVSTLPPTRPCSVSNGEGTQKLENGSYGTCKVTRCDGGFIQHEDSCNASSRSCTVSNGKGMQFFSNGSYGACRAISCEPAYVPAEGLCMAKERVCATANGKGVEIFTGASYEPCAATSCNSGFSLFQGDCFPSTRKCVVENGDGTQYFAEGSYGKCAAIACNKDFSLFQGVCFANSKVCEVKNGTGIQYFDGQGGYAACGGTSCNKTFALHGGACFPDFSGKWKGLYSYKSDAIDHLWASEIVIKALGDQVFFTMENVQSGGEISGSIVDFLEPWTLVNQQKGFRAAHFKGTVTQDGDFEFTKTYDDSSWPFDRPVKYKGKLSGGASSGGSWLIEVNGVNYTGAATFASCPLYLIPNGRTSTCQFGEGTSQ